MSTLEKPIKYAKSVTDPFQNANFADGYSTGYSDGYRAAMRRIAVIARRLTAATIEGDDGA